MELHARLFERNRKVHLIINKGAEVFRVSTKINAEGFDEKRQRWRKRKHLNIRMQRMLEAILAEDSVLNAKEVALHHIPRLRGLKEPEKAIKVKTIDHYMREWYECVKDSVKKTTLSGTRASIASYIESGEPLDAAMVDLYGATTPTQKAEIIQTVNKRLRQWKEHMVRCGERPGTQYLRINRIKQFFKWLDNERGIRIPCNIPAPQPDARQVHIPESCVRELLDKPCDSYYMAICKICLLTAMRFTDAFNLRANDIGENTITISAQKTEQTEVKYIPDKYAKQIREALPDKPSATNKTARNRFSTWLKDAVRNTSEGSSIVHHYRTKPDGQKERITGAIWQMVNPHDLRRASVNLMLSLGADPDTAMAQGGWKSPQVFQRHYVSPHRHLKKVKGLYDKL
jgi:integrase